MARKDKTFTGVDVVRFWIKNLEPEEQADVFSIFVLSMSIATARKLPTKFFILLLILVARFLPEPWGRILKFVLKILRIDKIAVDLEKFLTRATRVLQDSALANTDLIGVVRRIEDL